MIVLRARLLGQLAVELDGTAIDSPATQRAWTLFAYVALAGKTVTRGELAAVLWPDVLDESARASLRSALWALRRQIGDALVADRNQVSLVGVWTDIGEFEQLAAVDPAAALELCRGELLVGVDDDWASRARDRHRDRVIALLEQQAVACERDGEPGRALTWTRRQVDCDPFDEQAHVRLIVRLAAAGDRSGALRVYRAFAERLRRELGVAPSAATRAAVDELRAESVEPAVRPPAPSFSGVAGLLPLVGREREWGELTRAWGAAQGGAGAVAIVRGEAGIGKTRLATELRLHARASGADTASGAALDLGGTAPFSLWVELIRDLLPAVPAPPADATWPDDLAVLVAELPARFGRAGVRPLTVAPDLQRTRLFEAVVAFVSWAARERPLLLVLEDVHGADESSLELAGYAARRLHALPVMLLLTRRQQPERAAVDRLEGALRSRGLLACTLSLGPLAPDAVESVVRAAASLRDGEVARVVALADGNPLLAVETARAPTVDGQVAENLRVSVRATLGTLGGEARRLVELVAVAARPLEPVEVDQLFVGGASADAALESGLLDADAGRVGFRHALLRDAVYATIADTRRRGLHRAWAQAVLDAERAGGLRRPDEAAQHLRRAGADLDAVAQLARAALDARGVAALDHAVACLNEALEIAPERADLWLELGEIEAWRGRRAACDAAFERAIELLGRADQADRPARLTRARAWLRWARACHGPICVPRSVLSSARNALALLDPTTTAPERSEAIAACAWAEAVAGSVDEAERLLRELSAAAVGDPVVADLRTYDAGHARALVLMRRGRFTEAYGPSIAAGDAIARAGRPDLAYGCWANAAGAACAAGDHERALEFLDRGMAAVRGQGLASLEVHLLAGRSFVLRCAGRLVEARAAAEAEQRLAGELGDPGLEAMASHDLGLVIVDEGDHRSAIPLLEAALATEAPISRPLTRLLLAEALARAGEPARATEELRAAALEPIRPSDFPEALVPRLTRVQGLIALADGDRAQAELRLREALAGWERVRERTVRADSITSVLADLGRPVVGLIDAERELACVRGDLMAIGQEAADALVP